MTGKAEGFYVMAFNSTSHSIQTEKKVKELFRISVIPTPRELTNNCGLSIKFLDGDIDGIVRFYKTLTVPADLYFISAKNSSGKREVVKLP